MNYTKDQHFSLLAETTAAVKPVVDVAAYADIEQPLRASILPDMERCLEIRRRGLFLRPFLARICYELTGGQDWLEQVPVMASVELLNISTYQSNYCFDEKAEVKTVLEKNNQFICSMLTASKAISMVESFAIATRAAKANMVALLARSNHEVYQGQFQDLNVLNLDGIGNFSDLDEFLPVYLSRCDLIAGSTFRACAVGAVSNNPSLEIFNTLLAYLGALGTAAQMVNDLGDFIPYPTKSYAAPFSDFLLGRLTLPTFLLKKAGLPLDEWRVRLREEKRAPSVETALAEEIHNLKIESIVRSVIKKRILPSIKFCLSTLDSNFQPEETAPFRFAYPYIFDSRMLRYFRKDAGRAWPEKSI
uniref:Geranylgeranyl pyrophosphate synthase n=1 Tax=Candidatus Kentrum sp. FM TaxID=2126340 RepID=A0A450SEN7_9GAMM|nr:MAG: Geranylgeranyl pyrophosphate synthase [Candidatus Kentron sp. FM]VFJ51177.1 MAG: Geranylgeranyl pyrophosphate synthase [Candidatus Kentron sp. FM]VFK08850.1 MAG: Geranylgeranyl pyrophosphate synthase [Candidatus Kentron sp. FM]